MASPFEWIFEARNRDTCISLYNSYSMVFGSHKQKSKKVHRLWFTGAIYLKQNGPRPTGALGFGPKLPRLVEVLGGDLGHHVPWSVSPFGCKASFFGLVDFKGEP